MSDHERDALAEVLREITLQHLLTNGPTEMTYPDLADAILTSGWLAARDRRVAGEAVAAFVDEAIEDAEAFTKPKRVVWAVRVDRLAERRDAIGAQGAGGAGRGGNVPQWREKAPRSAEEVESGSELHPWDSGPQIAKNGGNE